MEKAPAYDPLDPMFSVKRMPCFRNACLWGIFTGLAMGAHRYRRTRMGNVSRWSRGAAC